MVRGDSESSYGILEGHVPKNEFISKTYEVKIFIFYLRNLVPQKKVNTFFSSLPWPYREEILQLRGKVSYKSKFRGAFR